MVKAHRRVLAILVLVTFWPTVSFGQAPAAGVVTTLEGTVTATRVALPQPVPLKFKDEVFLRDKVVTGDRSLARLLLGGKAVVTVRERSALTVTEVPGRSTVELESGKIGLAVARDKMRRGEVVDIRTSNAIVAVRGTVVVAEVTRSTAQVGGAPPVVTSAFHVLRGSADATRLNPATGSPIGPPVPVNVLTSFRVTGTAPPVIAPIPPGQVTQVVAGLSPAHPQHTDPANQDQVKTQVMNATAAVLGAVTGATLIKDPVPPVIAEVLDTTIKPFVELPPITPIDQGSAGGAIAPVVELLQTPEISITSDLTLDPGQTLRTFEDVFNRLAIAPLIQAGSASLPPITVTQLGPDNLIELKPGALVTLASRLITTENATVMAGNHFLRVDGTLTGASTSGLMFFDPSTVTSASDFLAVGPGGALVLNGPAIDALVSVISAGGNLVSVTGGVIQTAARLLNFVISDVDLANNLLRIADGSTVAGFTADALVGFDSSNYVAGLAFGSASGGSLLRMFSQTGQPGTTLSLAGPYLTAVNSDLVFNDSPPFNIADGAVIMSTSPLPFAQFVDSFIGSQNIVFNFDTGTQFTPPGQPTVVGSGAPVRVSLAGPLANLVDTDVFTANNRSFLRINNDVQIAQGGPNALIGFNNVLAQLAANLVQLTALPGVPPPVLTLGGSLVNALTSTIVTGDPLANTNTFVFVGDGSHVISQGAGPLALFTGVFVDSAGPLFTVRRSTPSQATRLTLAAALLIATDSFIDTTSLGFGNVFGAPSACCTSIVFEQGAILTGSTAAALVQLVRSVVNAGPDAQSGGGFLHLRDIGPAAGEIVAPATMSLAGPLLSSQNSQITSLFSTFFVGRATLASSTGAALIDAADSVFSAGGPDPLNGNATTAARFFVQVASDTAGTASAFPSVVSLAGPLAALTNTIVVTTNDFAGVFNGARFASSTAAALIQLANANVISSASSTVNLIFNSRLLTLANQGGVTGAELATMALNGGVLASTDGTMTMNGFIGVFPGAQLVVNGGGDAVALITRGIHDFAAVTGGGCFGTPPVCTAIVASPMFSLVGRSTALDLDPDERTLTVGTDQPIQTSRPLLDAVGATIRARKVAEFVDQTLLNATVEALFRARGGATITVAEDAIDLAGRNRVVLTAPVLALNTSSFTVESGSGIVVNNSHLKVTGDLFVVGNGSTLVVNAKGLPSVEGALVRVMNGGVLNVSGGLIRFEGPNDANTLRIFNTLCGGGDCNTFQGVRVGTVNNGNPANVVITGTPIKGVTPSTTIDLNGNNAAHVILDGSTSRITIGGN
ncbi:MAG: FecR domain-containing protein [Candidatus Rokuibacteriota bacterium]